MNGPLEEAMRKAAKALALLLALTITTGCATMTGIVTGPVVGPVSCLPEVAKDMPKVHYAWWEKIILGAIGLFSPIIGVVAGAVNGFEIDRDAILYDAKAQPHQIKTLFDPCGT